MDVSAFRHLFPVAEHYAYLNNAADGPPPLRVAEAMLGFVEDNHRYGCLNFDEWMIQAEAARVAAAELFNADADEIAFVKNTTQGLQIAAQALPIKKANIILINDMEFPANVFPWQQIAERHGARVKVIKSRVGRITPEMVAQNLNKQVKVLALSSVQYENGFRADLEAIGELCAEANVYFVVDAIQSVGAIPIDVVKAKIDFLAAGGHKWLLSVGGAGFLFCRKDIISSLRPTNHGWLSARDPLEFQQRLDIADGARRFEEGNPSVVGIYGLRASLEFLQKVGIANIYDHILGLGQRLTEGLEAKGYRIESPQGEGERSGITLFRGGPCSARSLAEKLAEAGVVVAVRSRGIRVSPHLYNDESDIDRLLDALP